VSYSRIYLGVHYPGDVICGALIGISLAWIVFYLYQYTCRKFAQFYDRKMCDNSVSTS
jgi:undecaprenyl-diphosphatase